MRYYCAPVVACKMMFMYKYVLFFLVSVVLCAGAAAQQNKKTTIAPFKIQLVNGKTFTYQQLQKNKPVVLVYFSPTCEHCLRFTEAMLKRKKDLAGKQIVMVTYLPLEQVKPFVDQYHLDDYPNIKVGTEGYSFIVRKYYDVQNFPFAVVYDQAGKLTKIVKYQPKSEDMAAQL